MRLQKESLWLFWFVLKQKRLICILFLLLVLAVGGLFVYVVTIDWNQHKDAIAEQFYKKARMLSPEKCRNDIEILISDCLICQGRIDDALEEELLYVGKRKIITGAINLKMLISKEPDV